ncbi:MAG: hypothetical protein QOI28_213, partial [Mycobacterium sp.]|nr:hypothetical protein [Mycobacterium sp.]
RAGGLCRVEFGLALWTTVVSAFAYAFIHLDADGSLFPITAEGWAAIVIFVPIALLANVMAGQARLRAAESNRRRQEAEASRDELRVLADQQAALPAESFRSTVKASRRWYSARAAPPGGTATRTRPLSTSNTSRRRGCVQASVCRLSWAADCGARRMSDRRDLSRCPQVPRRASGLRGPGRHRDCARRRYRCHPTGARCGRRSLTSLRV